MTRAQDEFRGPVEETSWPSQITGRVVTPGAEPRIHGYSVESDLLLYYRHAEATFLLLTGELPSETAALAFEVALVYLTPVSVAHASTHAGVLARLCGATTSATIAVSAAGLAEQARELVAAHAELLSFLDDPAAALPARYLATDTADHESVARLARALLQGGLQPDFLALGLKRESAALALLHFAGLKRPQQLEAAVVWARLPCALAEAFREKPTNFANYPTDLPHYRYRDPEAT